MIRLSKRQFHGSVVFLFAWLSIHSVFACARDERSRMASESPDATHARDAVAKKHVAESLPARKEPRSRDSVGNLYAPLSFATTSRSCALRAEIKYVQGHE